MSPMIVELRIVVLVAGLLAAGCGSGEGTPQDGAITTGAEVPGALASPGEDFGGGITLREVTPFADVVRRPEAYSDRTVLVRAPVYDVCQRKGCWMVLRDGSTHARVRFKDYGFFVPRDCTGQIAYVQGRVTTETVPEELARHYEAESARGEGAGPGGSPRIVAFEATGVRLLSRE